MAAVIHFSLLLLYFPIPLKKTGIDSSIELLICLRSVSVRTLQVCHLRDVALLFGYVILRVQMDG